MIFVHVEDCNSRRRGERRADVMLILSIGRVRWPQPLIHRCHGFLTGGGTAWEENNDPCSTPGGSSSISPGPWARDRGARSPCSPPHGRPWDPGHTFISYRWISIRGPWKMADPAECTIKVMCRFRPPEQLRGDQRRPVHPQVPGGRDRGDRGEWFWLPGFTCKCLPGGNSPFPIVLQLRLLAP